MKPRTSQILSFVVGIVLALSVYGFMMYGLRDFNDPNNTDDSFIGLTDNDDDDRDNFPFLNLTNLSYHELGEKMGELLWKTRAIDVIILGIILIVASESASSIVKGIEEQCAEFRQELCESSEYLVVTEKEEEQ
ncbi:MAG: hypothetical protein U9O98_05755 [Asgard group archaeon]|nr:hypothetical protein [Asgard group archaeon]